MKAYLTYSRTASNIDEIVETEFEVLPKEGDEIILDDATQDKLGDIIIKRHEGLYKYKSMATRKAHVKKINERNWNENGYSEQPVLWVNYDGTLGVSDPFFNTVGETKYIQINGKFYPLIRICDWAKYHNN